MHLSHHTVVHLRAAEKAFTHVCIMYNTVEPQLSNSSDIRPYSVCIPISAHVSIHTHVYTCSHGKQKKANSSASISVCVLHVYTLYYMYLG